MNRHFIDDKTNEIKGEINGRLDNIYSELSKKINPGISVDIVSQGINVSLIDNVQYDENFGAFSKFSGGLQVNFGTYIYSFYEGSYVYKLDCSKKIGETLPIERISLPSNKPSGYKQPLAAYSTDKYIYLECVTDDIAQIYKYSVETNSLELTGIEETYNGLVKNGVFAISKDNEYCYWFYEDVDGDYGRVRKSKMDGTGNESFGRLYLGEGNRYAYRQMFISHNNEPIIFNNNKIFYQTGKDKWGSVVLPDTIKVDGFNSIRTKLYCNGYYIIIPTKHQVDTDEYVLRFYMYIIDSKKVVYMGDSSHKFGSILEKAVNVNSLINNNNIRFFEDSNIYEYALSAYNTPKIYLTKADKIYTDALLLSDKTFYLQHGGSVDKEGAYLLIDCSYCRIV